ncbi:RusA family crossover junction endodeoxyribonuclease [Vibrio vulnificus]|nr:RusA family crossover junction endodeoxyribonuclease [Vibrio vulnificus]EIZ4670363.1 RusA family crossover junction endodeoxyribonuclease [Vibrio vulnificus]
MSIVDLEGDLGYFEHDEENCELYFNLYLKPVSLQSKNNEAKRKLQSSIKQALSLIDFYLVGNISFHITWNLHEHRRIETDGVSDIDNILKPIIDGFTGGEALLIDDNQVDDVHAQWAHYFDYNNDKFVVTIKYDPTEIIPKKRLFLLELENNIFIPIQLFEDMKQREIELHNILSAYNRRKSDIENQGYDRATRRKNRMQRFFHKSRISNEFRKGNSSAYLEQVL